MAVGFPILEFFFCCSFRGKSHFVSVKLDFSDIKFRPTKEKKLPE